MTSSLTWEESERAHRARVRLEMREAVLQTFPYDPSLRKESVDPEAGPEAPTKAQSDPDLVVLDTYEVRSRAFDRGLPEAIRRYHPPGPQNRTKFGTGIRQKDFGKVRASMVTILYIPVLVGFSW